MSKRKGLSADEKRQKMLEIFYEKKDFYQLKELEKLAPKEKGIVVQSVKDVVQSLVDDSLVDTDKIGTSVYYWAFPSKAKNNKKIKLDKMEEKITEESNLIEKLKMDIETAKSGREDSNERVEAINLNIQLHEQNDTLKQELMKFTGCDPRIVEIKKKEIQILKNGANQWTDNIFSIQSWCKKKFFVEEEILNKQFSIPAELDYIA